MVAMMMTVLLAMGAAAIDIGHALVARNELQNVSDAAALAGTRALGIIYEGMTTASNRHTPSPGAIKRPSLPPCRRQPSRIRRQGWRSPSLRQTSRLGPGILDQNAHSHGQPTESGTSGVEAGCLDERNNQYVPCECDRDVECQCECCGDSRHDGCRPNGTGPAGCAVWYLRVLFHPVRLRRLD